MLTKKGELEMENIRFVERSYDAQLATCNRCGYEWEIRVNNPRTCARCRSPYWNKPRKVLINSHGNANKYGFDALSDFKWRGFPFSLDSKDAHGMDWNANARRARSLEQFMRRKNWSYEHKLGKNEAGQVCLMVRRTK